MPTVAWIALALIALYAGAVLALMAAGRGGQARALAGFVPDCALLLKRLAADPSVPRRRRIAMLLLTGYLVMPIDLIPDFIPVAGQLDDAILVALVLRWVVRGGGSELVRTHWPGPEASLGVVLRLTGLATPAAAA